MEQIIFNWVEKIKAHIKGRTQDHPLHTLAYVADGANWVIDSEGGYITRGVKSEFDLKYRILVGTEGLSFLRHQIVHFGSQHLFTNGGYRPVHSSNRIVVTFFHGDARDPDFAPAVAVFRREIGRVSRVIVSCRIMEKRIAEWGIPPEKVIRVPIGVDLQVFRPLSLELRQAMRAQLGIGREQVVIGSFQKDGVGFAEGFEPKLIKGPDVFLQVIGCLRRQAPIFVLLTGPARGYVCRGLEQMGVPYKHILLNSYVAVAPYYHALDLYLVTSREEGGPKGVMESMATGVPLVSTRVGMAADLIQDGVNGFLCDIEDVEALTARALQVIGNGDVRERFRSNGYRSVEDCDFGVVARRHYEEVYRPLLSEIEQATTKAGLIK